jgi:hypothetical protein
VDVRARVGRDDRHHRHDADRIGIGEGKLLSRRLFRLQIAPRVGFGHPEHNCPVLCRKLTRAGGYGLGIFRNGPWIAPQPFFAGIGSVAAYLPSERISIAVTVALNAGAYNAEGVPVNYSIEPYRQIGRILAPHSPPRAS